VHLIEVPIMPQRWKPAVQCVAAACFIRLGFQSIMRLPTVIIVAVVLIGVAACSRVREDLDYSFDVEQTWTVEELDGQIVQFSGVEFRPNPTLALRTRITEKQLVDSRRILEIGGGTGFFSLFCATQGAKQVVVLASDHARQACVRYNVAAADFDPVVEVRLTPLEQDSIARAVKPTEQFDFVIIGTETTIPDSVLGNLLDELPRWLSQDGKGWVVCESDETKRFVEQRCEMLGYHLVDWPPVPASSPGVSEPYPLVLQIDPAITQRSDSR